MIFALQLLDVSVEVWKQSVRVERVSPAGLRAGVATFDYLCHGDLNRLQWHGSWHLKAVLEHYVQLSVYASQIQPSALLERYAGAGTRFLTQLQRPF